MEENQESAFVDLVTGHKLSCIWYKSLNFSTGFMNDGFFGTKVKFFFSAGFMNFGTKMGG
ncbi:hypothetical protein HanRHA438_Chr10g0447211 [Helianthus annuus]|uniref:Uncharacterized protein n=1 Tax=Helianthus annuus TaxID=4232 RepID=A0A9K3HWK6_HELAN|nr:hypothetical protein HanXRQr2_Chr10g0435061 [Helianthus annuus]KAJ0521281.1 hypothetical protein HanIR_Chr10g0469091 [Helianthus annuus]KAJ0879077.1 hypothetical protein HanRHA438_Chr10g0447211 [Helianthus annuus]